MTWARGRVEPDGSCVLRILLCTGNEVPFGQLPLGHAEQTPTVRSVPVRSQYVFVGKGKRNQHTGRIKLSAQPS